MSNYYGQLERASLVEFSDSLRRESFRAIQPDAEITEILSATTQLSRLVCEQALMNLDPHQSFYFLQKIQEKHPDVPNVNYDNIVGTAWKIEELNPELCLRMLQLVGVSADSRITDGK